MFQLNKEGNKNFTFFKKIVLIGLYEKVKGSNSLTLDSICIREIQITNGYITGGDNYARRKNHSNKRSIKCT